MNHKVQVCIRGWMTLKLSLSWKTVIFSSPPFVFFSALAEGLPPGEIGIVERSTCEFESVAVAAISAVV